MLHTYHIAAGSRFTAQSEYNEEYAVIVNAVSIFACSDGTDLNTGTDLTVKYTLYRAEHPTVTNMADLKIFVANLARLNAVQTDTYTDSLFDA